MLICNMVTLFLLLVCGVFCCLRGGGVVGEDVWVVWVGDGGGVDCMEIDLDTD